jgi:hypothetical protein
VGLSPVRLASPFLGSPIVPGYLWLVRHRSRSLLQTRKLNWLEKYAPYFGSDGPPDLGGKLHAFFSPQYYGLADAGGIDNLKTEASARYIQDGDFGLGAIRVDQDSGPPDIDARRSGVRLRLMQRRTPSAAILA